MREISLSTILAIINSYPELSAEWLIRGNGDMFKTEITDTSADKILKLVDTITTLQDALNAKTETIAMQNEKIKQLENLLKDK